jgi:hypothetical protein
LDWELPIALAGTLDELRAKGVTHVAVAGTKYVKYFQPHRYLDDLEIGVLHLAFGHFGTQWQQFDALQSGTVAEISLLTDAPFEQTGRLTNHCIMTFGACAYVGSVGVTKGVRNGRKDEEYSCRFHQEGPSIEKIQRA